MHIFPSFSDKQTHIPSNMKRSWIISYLIIFLLPVLINSAVYLKAYRTIEKQAQASQRSAVERLHSNMDNELRRLEEAISTISYDTNLNYLLNAQGMESFQQNYDTASRLFELNETLLHTLSIPSKHLVSDYYIFSPDNGLVFHNSGINQIDSYGKLPDNDSQQLFNLCQSIDTKSTQLFPFYPNSGSSYLVLLYPLPYAYLPKGYITLLLEHESLNQYLYSLYDQDGSQIYLTDQNFQSLNTKELSIPDDIFTSYDFSQDSTYSEYKNGDSNFYLYSVASDILPLHYLCTLPESVATASLCYMRQSLWISALFCIIGGGFLIIFLTHYNYIPWKKLLHTVESLSQSPIKNNTSEYQIILDALIHTYQEKATIEEVFQKQSKPLHAYYLTRMMKGHIGIESMDEEILQNMEKQMLLSNYTVLASLTDIQHNDWSAEHADLAKDAYLSFFETQIVQKIQQTLGATFAITVTEIYDYTVCVIGMEESETEDWQSKLCDTIESITKELSSSLNIQYYFSFSRIHHTLSELSDAWEEALYAISFAVMNQEHSLMFYEDIKVNDINGYSYPPKTEQTLINLIQIGDHAEVQTLICSLLNEIAKSFPIFETAKCTASDILCSITKTFNHLPDSSQKSLQNRYYSIIEDFMQSNSYKALRHHLLEASTLVTEEFAHNAGNTTSQSAWIPKIEEQLQAHLYNENLNVMFLSQQLGVSAKYLSSIYLEYKGISIMETIHKLRIEKFKELIREDSMNISDAAAAVGYSSIATLNRWVKKYEGVTPGQLKNIQKHT